MYILAAVLLHTNDGPQTRSPASAPAATADICLYLLSDICDLVPCYPKILEIEWNLHIAEADDVLNECWHHIRIRAQLLKFKDHNLRSQGANMQAHQSVHSIEDHLSLSHAKYSHARTALVKLGNKLRKVGWEHKFQMLRVTDLHPIDDLLDGEMHSTAVMSWIWRTHGLPVNNNVNLT